MTKEKYSPEERAKRKKQNALALIEWRRIHGVSADERLHRSQYMKRYWEQMPSTERDRISAIRSNDAKEQVSSFGRGHYVQLGYDSWKISGPRNMSWSEDRKKQTSEELKGKPIDWMKDKDKKERMLAKLHTPEVKAKARYLSCEDVKTNPRRGRFETNANAEDWHIRSPSGLEYHFRNLSHFIREHASLFDAHQLSAVGHHGQTRIAKSISRLSPRNKKQCNTAYGWTWCKEMGLG